MTGFPVVLASCLCGESGSSHWIPFQFDSDTTESLPAAIPLAGKSFNDQIDPILKYKGIGYNMETCVKVAESMGKAHLIIVSNVLLDDSEFITERPIHITYWSLNANPPTIVDHPMLTIIEGYDVNIYTEIQKDIILTRATYKDLILSALKEEYIVPII
jgi:hypothetical protein